MRTPTFGQISQAEFERRAALAREVMTPRKAAEHISVLRLLTASEPTRRVYRDVGPASRYAGVDPYDDDDEEFEAEYAGLFPPRSPEEAGRRLIAAAAARAARASEELTDAEADALFPPESGP